MALEIVSRTSAKKDLIILPILYWKAGITEYWRVDSRIENPHLEILRRGRTQYRAVKTNGGWVKSNVFGKSFRMSGADGKHGIPQYTLENK